MRKRRRGPGRDGVLSRRTDPPTSVHATTDEDVAGKMLDVLTVIRFYKRGGACTAIVHAETGIDKGSLSPRFKQLRDKNLIVFKLDSAGEIAKERHVDGNGRLCRPQEMHVAVEHADPAWLNK